jgi:elongation factor P
MDVESYDQFQIPAERLGDDAVWLTEGLQLNSIVLGGHVAGVSMPTFVELEVDTVGAGARGDTASGKALKDAVLVNGVTIKVPLFIDSGERIVVDLRTREYVRRA